MHSNSGLILLKKLELSHSNLRQKKDKLVEEHKI